MDDLISRQAALALVKDIFVPIKDGTVYSHRCIDPQQIRELPSAQPESTRTFVELVVEYPPQELCTYKEYKGKPYYSIKYIENGKMYVGYGTYNPEVLSQYLKEYFMSPAQPEIIRCKDCKYFELDHFEKIKGLPIPVIAAHEICMKWGDGCKSSVDGWCFMAERRTDSDGRV